MALSPDFVADSPYGPGGLLLDDVLLVDPDASRIVVRMPTHDELPITREQRAHPTRHPRHVSGGLMVHMTGMVAFAHAYYLLGMRHADGWIGYGGRIYDASRCFIRYDFTFRQGETLVYSSDQSAMWMKVES